MSLMRFLTIGRSLNPVNKAENPYRLRYGLPKFNTEKSQNVFQNDKSKTQPIEAGEVLPRVNVTIEKQAGDAQQREWLKQRGSKLFSTVRESCSSIVEKLPKLNILAKRRTGSVLEGRKLTGDVQAELSLDKVKVLRNDLSDADLEVVPLGSARASQRKSKLNPDEVDLQQTNVKQQPGELFQLQQTQT